TRTSGAPPAPTPTAKRWTAGGGGGGGGTTGMVTVMVTVAGVLCVTPSLATYVNVAGAGDPPAAREGQRPAPGPPGGGPGGRRRRGDEDRVLRREPVARRVVPEYPRGRDGQRLPRANREGVRVRGRRGRRRHDDGHDDRPRCRDGVSGEVGEGGRAAEPGGR